MRKLAWGLLLFGGLVGLWLAGPLWSAYRLLQAVQQANPDAISARVDYADFRESLKDEANRFFAREAAKQQQQGNLLGAIGNALGSTFINPLVDSLVTPDGVKLLVENGLEALRGQKSSGTQVGFGFRALDMFAISIASKGGSMALLFAPRGWGWKLVGIDLP